MVKHLPLDLAALVAVRARPHLPFEELKRYDGRRTWAGLGLGLGLGSGLGSGLGLGLGLEEQDALLPLAATAPPVAAEEDGTHHAEREEAEHP